ncbi:MAG: hypothetical protein GC161_13865 [Planctomycetaceae bacterium]|nr:hypothetical protein [Planctomycetaceae bacterium]
MLHLARFTLALAVLAIGACTPPRSIHSLVTDETRHFDSRLVGEWTAKDGDKTFTADVTADGDGYRVLFGYTDSTPGDTPNESALLLYGELTQIGGELMADLTIHPEALSKFEYADMVVPTHFFVAIEFRDDNRVACRPFYPTDMDAFEESVSPPFLKRPEQPKRKRSWVSEPILLTHPSNALRLQMKRWLAEPGHLTEESMEFRRVSAPH